MSLIFASCNTVRVFSTNLSGTESQFLFCASFANASVFQEHEIPTVSSSYRVNVISYDFPMISNGIFSKQSITLTKQPAWPCTIIRKLWLEKYFLHVNA